MKPLVIYHANCTDGFAAAFCAWGKFRYEADYLAMHYGEKLMGVDIADMQGRNVYILDFSFPREVMDGIFATAKTVVWLDHHLTAFEMWCPDKKEYYSSKDMIHSGDLILLDNNKSGALLAWEHFNPGLHIPMMILHVDDRDRWQFKIEGSREFHAALSSLQPWSFEQWESWGLNRCGKSSFYWELIQTGEALLRSDRRQVERMMEAACPCKIPCGGTQETPAKIYEGLAVNGSLHMSETGNVLASQSHTFGLVWYMTKDKKIACSFRSIGDYDVTVIAKAFGGGGHKNAAGCMVDVQTLLAWLG